MAFDWFTLWVMWYPRHYWWVNNGGCWWYGAKLAPSHLRPSGWPIAVDTRTDSITDIPRNWCYDNHKWFLWYELIWFPWPSQSQVFQLQINKYNRGTAFLSIQMSVSSSSIYHINQIIVISYQNHISRTVLDHNFKALFCCRNQCNNQHLWHPLCTF